MASRMDRGEYRSFYVAMADDPDIHALSGNAFKLLFMLKCSLGPAGIGVVYPSKLCDQVGVDRTTLEQLFQELEADKPANDHGWIERERNVVWIINGLSFEPNFSPLNVKKHVPYIRGLVAALSPNLTIVQHFKAHYPEWFVDEPKQPAAKPAKSSGKGTDTLSSEEAKAGSNGTQSDRVSIHKTRQDKTTQNSGDPGKERSRAREHSAPLADALAALPDDVGRFIAHFYPRGVAAKDRREDVARQILGTLNGGTLLREGHVVYAFGEKRLARKCRDVVSEGVQKADRAIVVLLMKLNDTSDVTEAQAKHDAGERAAQERERDRELAAAEAWLADHPLIATTIASSLESLGYGTADAELEPAEAVSRAFTRTSLVLEAWRKAGAPEVAHV